MNIKEQIQNAIVDMMSKVRRVDRGNFHNYVRESDGKALAGVTEVSSAAGYKEAKGWMPAWGSKEAVRCFGYFELFDGETHEAELKETNDVLAKVKKMTLNEYLDFLHEAKGGYMRKSEKARETGVDGHEWLEMWVKAQIRKEIPPNMPDSFNSSVKKGMEEFFTWAKENVSEFLLAEARVADIVNEYAGTLDVLAIMKSGDLAVLDFKFADNISITWPLQLVAYAETFRQYGITVKERYVIRFPKSEWLKKWNPKIRKYKKVENKLEILRYAPECAAFDFETFLHYRAADKWVNAKVK